MHACIHIDRLATLSAAELWELASDDLIASVRLDQALCAVVEQRPDDALVALAALRDRMLAALAERAPGAGRLQVVR